MGDYRRHPVAVSCPRRFRIHSHREVAQRFGVTMEYPPLVPDELFDAFDLPQSDGCLQVGHLVFEADHVGPELLLLAFGAPVVAQGQHFFEKNRVIGDEHAPFACRQRLRSVKGESAKDTRRAGPLASGKGRTDGFRCIFDDGDAMLCADLPQAIHFTQVAVEMDGQDCLGLGPDGFLDGCGIKAPAVFEDVDEHGRCAEIGDGRR